MTKEKSNRIGQWLAWFAALMFIVPVAYSIYAFRASPKIPDTIHTVALTEHGDTRYMTPLQYKLCLYGPFAGIGLTFLVIITGSVALRSKKNES
jgi:hypothetical protein